MPSFTPKDWEDYPSTDTPISAAALEDAEDRLTDYADSVAAAGIELGYAEITSSVTQTGVGSADVAGLSTTVTVASRPIVVRFDTGSVVNSATNGYTYIRIQESTTVLAEAVAQANGVANVSRALSRTVRLTPSAGSHTYKILMGQLVAGNSVLTAAANSPVSIQVIEV